MSGRDRLPEAFASYDQFGADDVTAFGFELAPIEIVVDPISFEIDLPGDGDPEVTPDLDPFSDALNARLDGLITNFRVVGGRQ